MYRSILTIVFACSLLGGLAQPNNPYNQNGADYAKSLELIREDYNAGRIKDFDEATLQYYSRKLALKTDVSAELASRVVSTLKKQGYDYSRVSGAAKLSATAKQLYQDLASATQQMKDTAAYHQFLRKKVNEVLATNLPREEQELLLTQLAMIYNLNATMRSSGCEVTVNGQTTVGTGNVCISMGIVLGGFIGLSICGVLCGIGGAIIGGVLGSLS